MIFTPFRLTEPRHAAPRSKLLDADVSLSGLAFANHPILFLICQDWRMQSGFLARSVAFVTAGAALFLP